MSRAPYDPQLEMLDEMREIRETLDRIALALEGPRPPEPDPNEQWDQANELWNEARKMALAAAQVLMESGCWDEGDKDLSELHEAIYLRIGGKPSDPERRPS